MKLSEYLKDPYSIDDVGFVRDHAFLRACLDSPLPFEVQMFLIYNYMEGNVDKVVQEIKEYIGEEE